ncbi:hypothetical protein EHQ50_08495 [Leptospira meyeri]|nr:hypothetical protein EHQ50_08495 [Leptospira meyeri]
MNWRNKFGNFLRLDPKLLSGGMKVESSEWEEEQIFTKTKIAEILTVDEKTIDRYIEKQTLKLAWNGYRILKGEQLKKLFGDDINVVTKTTCSKPDNINFSIDLRKNTDSFLWNRG